MNINDLKIIDTHHHLWDPTTKKYDWLTASGHEVFNHVYRKENFINDLEETFKNFKFSIIFQTSPQSKQFSFFST